MIPLAEKLRGVPQKLIRTALEAAADRAGKNTLCLLAGLHRAER